MVEISNSLSYFFITLFCVGYALIIFEAVVGINKATTALFVGALLWVLIFASQADSAAVFQLLAHHFSNNVQFLFFLWAAMAAVEIMGAHHALQGIAKIVNVSRKQLRFWILGITAFFLGSVIDNLAATIVMIGLTQKLISEKEERLIHGAAVVLVANAGGAWSPIGAVTTTMLWIGGQISTIPVITELFIPSAVAAVTALGLLSRKIASGSIGITEKSPQNSTRDGNRIILPLGIVSFMMVPFLKITIGLPPCMGMLLMMSFLGICSEACKPRDEKGAVLHFQDIILRVEGATLLFFLGILLSVSALETVGVLKALSEILRERIASFEMIAFLIGIVSAVIDNVPIVAATIGMYPLQLFPKDAPFWHLIAYTAAVGGNLLIIGSAAGVAFMGMERVSFFWYVRHITLIAFVSYIVGFAAALLLS